MAFQKTQGRKKFVQPAGSPDLSGFRRAASLYDQVGKDIYDIGTRNRNAKLADLVLQAEAEGITAASTYDKDGNIVPLRNFEVSDMLKNQGFSNSDRKTIEQAYRKAAINTYQGSIGLQAKAVAEQALIKNPDKPEQILGAMEGFIDGLELPPEMAPYIMPYITSEFVEKQSQATAERLRQSNLKTKDINLRSIKNSTGKIAKIMSSMAGLPPEEQNNAERMISELQESIAGNYEALETVGYTETQIDDLRKESAGIIQTRMAIGHVERKYLSTGDYAGAKREVEALFQEFRDDPSIDAETLRKAMDARLTELKQINDAEVSARDKIKASNYGDALLHIALGGSFSAEEIASLDVSNNQRASIVNTLDGALRTRRNDRININKEQESLNTERFESLMLQVEDPNLPQRMKQEAAFAIQRMRSDPPSGIPITASQYSRFITEMSKQQVGSIKAAGDLYMADLEYAMAEKLLTVKDLKELTPFLREKGYVGDTTKGAQMDNTAWSKLVTQYMSDLSSDAKEAKKLSDSHRNVVQGTANKEDHAAVADTTPFKEAFGADNLSFGSSDPAVRDENSYKATQYALAYKTLPPKAVDFLKAINTSAWSDNEGMYDAGRMLFDRILYSLTTGITRDGQTDIRMGEIAAIKIMEDSGVDTSQYIRARRTTHKDFFAQRASVKATRKLSDVEAKLGMPLIDKIQMSFSEALDTNRMGVIAQFIPGLAYESDKRIEHTMDMLENQIGLGVDLSDVQLNDPLFLLHINARVRQMIATGKIDLDNEESFNHGLKLAATQISDSIGINVDSSGRAYWAMSPWIKDAQAEIGDAPLPLSNTFSGEMSPAEAVFFDIRTRMKGMSTLSPKIIGLLNDEDSILKLVQEPLMGPEQLYTVQVQDPDSGEVFNIQRGYRFRWDTSALNPIMKAAEARITNSGFKQFFNRFNFINKSFLQAEMTKIVRDMNDDVSIFAFEGTGRDEFMRNVSNVLKRVYNVAFPYEDFEILPKYDEGDVEVINALLSSLSNNGGMTFEDFLKEIEGLYE